jgi:CRISPR system Cascade subunit CasE
MVQLDLDVAFVTGLARDQGAARQRWDDLGYFVHQHLTSLFHDLSPQPFRTVTPRGRWLNVLGYTTGDAGRLRQSADELGPPQARAACRLDDLRTKPMPDSLFAAGRRFGFEVRTCPVVRLASEVATTWVGAPRTFRAGAELDAFLHRRYLQAESGDRESVYVDWLRQRLDGAAGLLDVRLQAFRRVRVLRRGRRDGEGKRKTEVAERPDALLTGTLGVTDPDAFRDLLARGVGRHRAFGFGMLLLRAPGRR